MSPDVFTYCRASRTPVSYCYAASAVALPVMVSPEFYFGIFPLGILNERPTPFVNPQPSRCDRCPHGRRSQPVVRQVRRRDAANAQLWRHAAVHLKNKYTSCSCLDTSSYSKNPHSNFPLCALQHNRATTRNNLTFIMYVPEFGPKRRRDLSAYPA